MDSFDMLVNTGLCQMTLNVIDRDREIIFFQSHLESLQVQVMFLLLTHHSLVIKRS